MPYYRHLSCLCMQDASGYPVSSGRFPRAFLSGDMAITSDMEPSASGIIHSSKLQYTEFAPLFSVQDLSPEAEPNTKYRVFVDTRDFRFAPENNDLFIVESGGTSYKYRITSVSIS